MEKFNHPRLSSSSVPPIVSRSSPGAKVDFLRQGLLRAAWEIEIPLTREILPQMALIEGLFPWSMECEPAREFPRPFTWPLDILPSVVAAIDDPGTSPSGAMFELFQRDDVLMRLAGGMRLRKGADAPKFLSAMAAPHHLFLGAAISLGRGASTCFRKEAWNQLPTALSNFELDFGIWLLEKTLLVCGEIRDELARLKIASVCTECGRLYSPRRGAEYCLQETCRENSKKTNRRKRSLYARLEASRFD
jgi:hypothetical protein